MEESKLLSEKKTSEKEGSTNPFFDDGDQEVARTEKTEDKDVELTKPREIQDKPGRVRSHYEEIDEVAEHIPCCYRLKDKLPFKIFIFSLTACLDFLDFLSDWLLYGDVRSIKEGLVYGPIEPAILHSILIFAIIGTIAIIFELANIWRELFLNRPWIDPDLASAIFLWTEDIPQIVLSVRISLCREEAISLFQMLKASVILYGIVLRIGIYVVRYCDQREIEEIIRTKKHAWLSLTYRGLIIAGMVVILLGSASIFLLTYFERTPNDRIKFNHPKTIFEEKYNEGRYFNDVSMFFNHPLFERKEKFNNSRLHFIRLTSINDVRKKKGDIFKISYDEETKTKFVIWHTKKSGKLPLKAEECYTIDKVRGVITPESSCEVFLEGVVSAYIFKFVFTKESIPELRFGDIKYNVRVNENGTYCHGPMNDIVTKIENRKGKGHYSDAVIHYYRTKPGINNNNHLIVSGNKARFYVNDKDLIDITKVWKTGFSYCQSTGSLAPHINKNIHVNCNS